MIISWDMGFLSLLVIEHITEAKGNPDPAFGILLTKPLRTEHKRATDWVGYLYLRSSESPSLGRIRHRMRSYSKKYLCFFYIQAKTSGLPCLINCASNYYESNIYTIVKLGFSIIFFH